MPPDFQKYRAVSSTVFEIFREVTPLVEPLSLDEAYLDVTENAWGEPLAMNVARRIKDRIREATGLTASAGVAPNKFLAKIASGWKKPDGLTVIAPERVEAFLENLPVDALWGVGPVTAKKLHGAGIHTTRDVRAADPAAASAPGREHGRLAGAARARRRRPGGGARQAGQVVGNREHLPAGPDRPRPDSRRNRVDGARRRRPGSTGTVSTREP